MNSQEKSESFHDTTFSVSTERLHEIKQWQEKQKQADTMAIEDFKKYTTIEHDSQ